MMMYIGITVIAQDAEHGALPTLYAATQDIAGNTYVGPRGLGQMRGAPVVMSPSRSSQDPDLAKRLWARSAELTGWLPMPPCLNRTEPSLRVRQRGQFV